MVFKLFMTCYHHMLLATDCAGTVTGLLTLEDVMEEILQASLGRAIILPICMLAGLSCPVSERLVPVLLRWGTSCCDAIPTENIVASHSPDSKACPQRVCLEGTGSHVRADKQCVPPPSIRR